MFYADKKSLRKHYLNIRSGYSDQELLNKDNKIYLSVKNILESIDKNFNSPADEINRLTIAIYYPLPGEPDLVKFSIEYSDLWNFAMPKMCSENKNSMNMCLYNMGDVLEEATIGKGLFQPEKNLFVKPNVAVIPAIAISVTGKRLGYGYGYYDRYIQNLKDQNHNIVTIGVCYGDCLANYIPYNQKYDMTLDYVVTEYGIISIVK